MKIRLLGGPRRWWGRWREGLYSFRREDGLYLCVIEKSRAAAWEAAREGYEDYDDTPEWARAYRLGTLIGDMRVVAIDYERRTVTLETPSTLERVTFEAP